MLDAFIIEEIRRREREDERRRDDERPRIEIPVAPSPEPVQPRGEDKPERGVVIIDYSM